MHVETLFIIDLVQEKELNIYGRIKTNRSGSIGQMMNPFVTIHLKFKENHGSKKISTVALRGVQYHNYAVKPLTKRSSFSGHFVRKSPIRTSNRKLMQQSKKHLGALWIPRKLHTMSIGAHSHA